MLQTHKVEARIRDRLADVRGAVSVAEGLLQHDTVAGVGLDGEGKEPIRRENAGSSRRDRDELADIDENVGRHDEMDRA